MYNSCSYEQDMHTNAKQSPLCSLISATPRGRGYSRGRGWCFVSFRGETPETRDSPWAYMLNPVGVRYVLGDWCIFPGFHPGLTYGTPLGFYMCCVIGVYPGDSPRVCMWNPVGVLYVLCDRRISRGFSPGLHVESLRGIFLGPQPGPTS